MELEEADEDVHKDSSHHHGHHPHHHGHPHHTPHKGSDIPEDQHRADQRLWDADGDGSDREQHGPRHGSKASGPGAPGAPSSGLLERLRSLANCDGPPPPPPPPAFRPHFGEFRSLSCSFWWERLAFFISFSFVEFIFFQF